MVTHGRRRFRRLWRIWELADSSIALFERVPFTVRLLLSQSLSIGLVVGFWQDYWPFVIVGAIPTILVIHHADLPEKVDTTLIEAARQVAPAIHKHKEEAERERRLSPRPTTIYARATR